MRKNKALLIANIVWFILGVIAIVLFVLELFVESAPILHKVMSGINAFAALGATICNLIYLIRIKSGK